MKEYVLDAYVILLLAGTDNNKIKANATVVVSNENLGHLNYSYTFTGMVNTTSLTSHSLHTNGPCAPS